MELMDAIKIIREAEAENGYIYESDIALLLDLANTTSIEDLALEYGNNVKEWPIQAQAVHFLESHFDLYFAWK